VNDVIGRHGITVVLDALAEFAEEFDTSMSDAARNEWSHISMMAEILADRTALILQGGISLDGRENDNDRTYRGVA